MRSKRTDRKSLKAELERIRRENAELRTRVEAQKAVAVPVQNEQDASSVAAEPPIILSGGYPAKAAVRTAKSLKEAKEILMSSSNW